MSGASSSSDAEEGPREAQPTSQGTQVRGIETVLGGKGLTAVEQGEEILRCWWGRAGHRFRGRPKATVEKTYRNLQASIGPHPADCQPPYAAHYQSRPTTCISASRMPTLPSRPAVFSRCSDTPASPYEQMTDAISGARGGGHVGGGGPQGAGGAHYSTMHHSSWQPRADGRGLGDYAGGKEGAAPGTEAETVYGNKGSRAVKV